MKIIVLSLFVISAVAFPACSNSGVVARQEAIGSAQGGMLNNRASRIEARDARMRASRDVWMQ